MLDDFLLILQGQLNICPSSRLAPPTLLNRLSSSSLELPGSSQALPLQPGSQDPFFSVKGQIGSSALGLPVSVATTQLKVASKVATDNTATDNT